MLCTDTQTIAKILNTNCPKNVAFKGVATDSRTDVNGALFLALVGDNFDAHDFTNQVQSMGAVAIIASKPIVSDLPVLQVADTQIALAEIAKWHLQNIKPKVVAITGSNGKTTVKNMLANILSLQAPTLATKGNLNNHLGVPMTLLNLQPRHKYAVIEMGANHLGEIQYLRKITTPDIALVTNTADAHIGTFGSFDNLVRAKGEIYSNKSQNIVNTQTSFTGDISFTPQGAKTSEQSGDVFATNIDNQAFTLNIKNEKITIKLQLLGRHNIDNALAASSCAYALGIDIGLIKQGLEITQAPAGRLNIIYQKNLTIIDDSYNANPASMEAAITTLSAFKGEKIAVLGTMSQLGSGSVKLHQQIGELAQNSLDKIYTYGEFSQHYGGINFQDLDELSVQIKTHSDATVLIKGSRVVELDRLVKLLQS